MDTLDPAKQSRYIGWQGAAYNVAKVFTSGLIIYLAGVLEKHWGNSGMDCYYAYLWRHYAPYWPI